MVDVWSIMAPFAKFAAYMTMFGASGTGLFLLHFGGSLSPQQLKYCSNDVIYLHKIKEDLSKMLVRESRVDLYESSIKFLKTRIKLDQQGFTEDIFSH